MQHSIFIELLLDFVGHFYLLWVQVTVPAMLCLVPPVSGAAVGFAVSSLPGELLSNLWRQHYYTTLKFVVVRRFQFSDAFMLLQREFRTVGVLATCSYGASMLTQFGMRGSVVYPAGFARKQTTQLNCLTLFTAHSAHLHCGEFSLFGFTGPTSKRVGRAIPIERILRT